MDIEGKISTLPLHVSDIPRQGHCSPFHSALFPLPLPVRIKNPSVEKAIHLDFDKILNRANATALQVLL